MNNADGKNGYGKTLPVHPAHVAAVAKNQKYMGRMNDPDAAAVMKGLCGDEMEFYLIIEHRKIKEVKFYTEGCVPTIACASTVAHMALGKTIKTYLKSCRIYHLSIIIVQFSLSAHFIRRSPIICLNHKKSYPLLNDMYCLCCVVE